MGSYLRDTTLADRDILSLGEAAPAHPAFLRHHSQRGAGAAMDRDLRLFRAVAIMRKQLGLTRPRTAVLQILSVTVFPKVPVAELFA
jgi:hypothetical protein